MAELKPQTAKLLSFDYDDFTGELTAPEQRGIVPVACIAHPHVRRSYVVCVHVADGSPIRYFARATRDNCGEVLCETCAREWVELERGMNIDGFRVVCSECLRIALGRTRNPAP